MYRFPVKSAPGQIDPTATGSCALWTSCGTVALYGSFFWRTIGLRISPYQKFAELRPRICRTFQQLFSQQKAL
jgi:hypothetical protein